MKNFLTLVFICISLSVFSQKGSFSIINMGNSYRVSVIELPKVPNLVYYDTRELRIDLYCIPSMVMDRTTIAINSNTTLPVNIDYYLNGNIYIYVDVIYKKNNIIVGRQSMIPKCIFGLNPTNCVVKL